MVKKFALTGAAMCVALAMPLEAARAGSAEEDAKAFGARQSILDISLSPSGRWLAFIGSGAGHDESLNIIDLEGDMTVRRVFTADDFRSDISNCDWASDERLICQIYGIDDSQGILLGYTRLIALNRDGGNPIVLTPHASSRELGVRQYGGGVVALEAPGDEGRILMTKQYVEESTSGTRFASSERGLGVEAIDAASGKSRTVEKADISAASYIADEKGRVRMVIRQPSDGATGNVGSRVLFYYRTPDSDRWEKLSEAAIDGQTFSGLYPVAVDTSLNVAYAFDGGHGFDRLVTIALDGTGAQKVVLSRDDVDVDQLIRIGRQRRVVGASFASEKRQIEYFDPQLAALAAQLHKALPGQPLIGIEGASEDENRLIITASSDVDPGRVYLLDRQKGELNELLPLRSQLEGRQMGEMKPVTFPASDGTRIPGYLTLPVGSTGKGLPAIVLPHGGPSARDEWGFDWLVQYFVSRGYAVLQPNFRGSSGYGDAWFGRNGFKAWETAVGDVNDAGRWLIKEGIAQPDKLAIVGWSYGGYAALQSQVLDPDLYKAVVAIAPVTDLIRMKEDARKYTTGGLVNDFIGDGPYVRAGSPAAHADRFKAPVQLFHGTLDQNVEVVQSRTMADSLDGAGKEVEYNELKGLTHSLSDSQARADMLLKIDGFLAAALAK